MARVLVVDDNEDVRELLQTRLAAYGHEIVSVADGKACIEVFDKESFDLIVLDLVIPGTSGIDVLQQIRTESRNPKVPVIVITGFVSREIIPRVLGLEVVAVLSKPFSFSLLVNKINSVLNPVRSIQVFDPASVRIFLEATTHIFYQLARLPLTAGKPFLKSGDKAFSEYSAVIGFSHKYVRGTMAVNMDSEVLELAYLNITHLTEQKALSPGDLMDCCGEIANQILGRAKRAFQKERNLSFEMSVPIVLHGKEHVLNYKSQSSVLVIPFSYEKKSLFVEFCIDENARDEEENDPLAKKNPANATEGEFIYFGPKT